MHKLWASRERSQETHQLTAVVCIGYASCGQERWNRAGPKARLQTALAMYSVAIVMPPLQSGAIFLQEVPFRGVGTRRPRRIHRAVNNSGGVSMARMDLVTAGTYGMHTLRQHRTGSRAL